MRRLIKLLAGLLANCVALLSARIVGLTEFWHVSVWLGKKPLLLGVMIRERFDRRTLDEVGDDVYFASGCNFSYQNIKIGNHVRIGYGNCIGLVDIGDNSILGANCLLPSGAHMHGFSRRDVPIRLQSGKLKRISIGNDCWIDRSAIVMADVGDGCVVGAGTVVTKAVPPWSIVAGNPAKVVGIRGARNDEPANAVPETEDG